MFQAVLAVWAVALALTQGIVWHTTHAFSFALLLVFLLLGGCLWGVLFRYFQRQSALLEQAVQQIQSCLDGNPDARLDCDREGEFYRLFHSVNALAAVLSAHADNEQRECNLVRRTEKGRLRRRGWGLRWEKAQKGGKGTNLRGFFED